MSSIGGILRFKSVAPVQSLQAVASALAASTGEFSQTHHLVQELFVHEINKASKHVLLFAFLKAALQCIHVLVLFI